MKPMMSNSGDKELWKHSMRVAAGCEYLANLTKIMDSDEAFISGFIHDIGKMVLNMTNDKLYAKVKDRVSEGADILEAERKYFDSDHVKRVLCWQKMAASYFACKYCFIPPCSIVIINSSPL